MAFETHPVDPRKSILDLQLYRLNFTNIINIFTPLHVTVYVQQQLTIVAQNSNEGYFPSR